MDRRNFIKTTMTAAVMMPLARLAGANEKKSGGIRMEYRELGKNGLKVSAIALGVEGFRSKNVQETKEMIDYAVVNGINFMDICMADPDMLANLQQAVGSRRNGFVIQGHIGSVWEYGQYRRTRNMTATKLAFGRMLDAFGGTIDVGMIHYVDDVNDFENVFNGETIAFVRELKMSRKIKAIGLSSHNPEIARRAVESGMVDVIMFSINPGYDLRPFGGHISYDKQRQDLYELCAAKNIGIDVMKAYGGGDLLNARLSPFGKAFMPVQALNYALTRPAVAAVMVGCDSIEQIAEALAWCGASAEEKDYSWVFAGLDARSWSGHCLYCGHCAPCPKGINIADVNKYLNLALAQEEVPATVRDHYRLLKHHASECIGCGACESRCPFQVSVREKMKEATRIFGI